MSLTKKISTIIPCYNTEKWLARCLDSVLSQQGDFKNEIIVIDDHSTDSSMQLLEDYKRRYPSSLSFYLNPDKGANSARNYGFQKSTGDFIQWLDSDDQILPGKFNTQLKYLENNPSIDIVYSDWRFDFFEKEKKVNEKTKYERAYDDYLIELLSNNWQANSAYLMKSAIAKHLFDQGLWNIDSRVAQDREYFTYAAMYGAKFGYVSGVFSVYNKWSSQTISNRQSFREISKNSLRLNQKFYECISESKTVKIKNKYKRILNAEILNVLFNFGSLNVPRKFPFWILKISHLHWKKRLLMPLLYIFHLFKSIKTYN